MVNDSWRSAISVKLGEPFDFSRRSLLVLQYELRIPKKLLCGVAYMQLYPSMWPLESLIRENWEKKENSFDPTQLHNFSPYVILFGPHKCGDIGYTSFLLAYRNKTTGFFTERSVKRPIENGNEFDDSPLTHLFRLELELDDFDDTNLDADSEASKDAVQPTNEGRFRIFVDEALFYDGTLLQDMEPPLLPPNSIPDPDDLKPADWDDRETVDDPTDEKPSDWDVPAELTLEKPIDWIDDMDGEWERVTIPNPEYKGPWKARQLLNPSYRGAWQPRHIPNPAYHVETHPAKLYAPIGGVGFDIWSNQGRFFFDNLLLTSNLSHARALADLWKIKHQREVLLQEQREYDSLPWWPRRYLEAVMEFSDENPLTFAFIFVAFCLPFIAYAILQSKPSKSSNKRQKADKSELRNDAFKKTDAKLKKD